MILNSVFCSQSRNAIMLGCDRPCAVRVFEIVAALEETSLAAVTTVDLSKGTPTEGVFTFQLHILYEKDKESFFCHFPTKAECDIIIAPLETNTVQVGVSVRVSLTVPHPAGRVCPQAGRTQAVRGAIIPLCMTED